MIVINGKHAETISVHDRGLLYGDGVFETIAIKNGRMQLFDMHMRRLITGCEALLMPSPDINVIKQEAQSLCMGKGNHVLKIIITRGPGERGYTIPDQQQPTRIIEISPFPEYPATYASNGVNVMLCQHRLGINPALAGIKHLNRLEQILARSELKNSTFFEGLMMDVEGNVVEGTMTNLFSVKAGKLFTPDLTRCGVAGVMRNMVLELADKNSIPCHIGNMKTAEFMESDEIFLTNSLVGICPVKQIDQQQFNPGIITKTLQTRLHETTSI
ncbi:MAG: aminodeoxychorismate lyase [Gammaproteobacteria bacterium]|nr:aminodeoxychorismate lyase [Gammaproteobacteria bacterium]